MTNGGMRIGSAFAALGAGALLCGMAPGDMSVAAFLARAGRHLENIPRIGSDQRHNRHKPDLIDHFTHGTRQIIHDAVFPVLQ